MLSFCNEDWIFRHGPSRFEVYIMANHRKPRDVGWSLELHYTAAGARWRRVQEHLRPDVHLSLNSWHLPGRKWTDLEDLKFWGGQEELEKETGMPWFLSWEGGDLDLCYRETPGEAHQISTGLSVDWQVRERQGSRFLVEVAAGAGRLPPLEEKALVLADGEEERSDAERRDPADFWKENATVYALEWVPFGKVTVRVPRNAPDHVAYARRRAHELLGVSQAPEAYQIHDFLEMKSGDAEERASNGLNDDVYVKLHFHAYHEDE